MRKGTVEKGLKVLAVSSTLFIYSIVLFATPKVEKYSQNSAIEFMKSMRDKDVYVGTLYKSYAKLFYPAIDDFSPDHSFMQLFDKVKNKGKKDFYFTQWLLEGKIDKPAYFVVRIDKLQENLKYHKNLEIIEEKNGYVFLKRKSIISDKTE